VEVRHWLAQPSDALRGLWFLPISHGDDIGQRSRRRRASRSRPGARGSPGRGTGTRNRPTWVFRPENPVGPTRNGR
jgi:hypothetical protein